MVVKYYLQVCFATCFDPNILADLQSNEGKMLHLKPTSADIAYRYFTCNLMLEMIINHVMRHRILGNLKIHGSEFLYSIFCFLPEFLMLE